MVKVEITGFKEIEKNGRTLYYLSAVAVEPVEGFEGFPTYNAFVSEEHLRKNCIARFDLLGSYAEYYNTKRGDTYKSGITFKNSQKGVF